MICNEGHGAVLVSAGLEPFVNQISKLSEIRASEFCSNSRMFVVGFD